MAAAAALAEAPGVEAQGGVAELGQLRPVRRALQRGAAVQQLVLAEHEVAAVGVAVEDHRERPGGLRRPHEGRGHRLEPVEVEQQALAAQAAPLLYQHLLDGHRPAALGQLAEQRQQLGAPGRVPVRLEARGRSLAHDRAQRSAPADRCEAASAMACA